MSNSLLIGRLRFLASLSLVALACVGPALGQDSWQPFKERDERAAAAARERSRKAVEDPPREPAIPVEQEQPAFTPQPKSSVEKVDLEPLPPLPAQDGPPPGQLSPGQPSNGGPPPPAGGASLPPAAAAAAVAVRPATGAGSTVASPTLGGGDLPSDLWRGVDMRQLEGLIQSLDVPPRSAAGHTLWQRLFLAKATPPAGGQSPNHFSALQHEVLYRSGLIEPLRQRLAMDSGGDDAMLTAFRVRAALAAGDSEVACTEARKLTGRRPGLPKALAGEAHILAGYCAAFAGNMAAAGLAAELAREEGVEATQALQALDAIAAPAGGPQPKFALPKRLMVLDYRLLALAGALDPVQVLNSAEPALLYALSQSTDIPAALAVGAAEAAAALNALSPGQLAEVYTRIDANGSTPPLRRAATFKQWRAEASPSRKLVLARQMLDEARRSGFMLSVARVLALDLATLEPQPDLGPLASTAAEIAIAGGDFERARRFAASSPQAVHWAPLAELADVSLRSVTVSAFAVLDDAVRRGRFSADQLHRLAVVLDALDMNVPIPLWEAASRTPQPTSGYLPETGTLPQMLEAATKREAARTALLVLRAIGPQGPDATNLIALGDSLRALRRIGLDGDARRLAAEALLAAWPRS